MVGNTYPGVVSVYKTPWFRHAQDKITVSFGDASSTAHGIDGTFPLILIRFADDDFSVASFVCFWCQ